MRTCETCKYEEGSYWDCTRCGREKLSWAPNAAVQLAAKDAIIEGLVEKGQRVISALCAYCRDKYGQECAYGPKECTLVEQARAAIAAAKEE